MILPVLKNFTITKGVSFDYRLQWLQGAPGSTLAHPLTTYTGTMALTSWDGLTTYTTLSTSALTGTSGLFLGGDAKTPANGIIDIVLVASDTAAITWQSARYNLALTDTSTTPNTVTRILYGSVTVFGFLP